MGRGGSIAHAHLFCNTQQKNMDSAVKAFGSESENCRRMKLLEAVGSSEMICPGNLCCDGCVRDGLPLRLQFEKYLQHRQVPRDVWLRMMYRMI